MPVAPFKQTTPPHQISKLHKDREKSLSNDYDSRLKQTKHLLVKTHQLLQLIVIPTRKDNHTLTLSTHNCPIMTVIHHVGNELYSKKQNKNAQTKVHQRKTSRHFFTVFGAD